MTESDDSLRARIMASQSCWGAASTAVLEASGSRLDEYAAELGVEPRITEPFPRSPLLGQTDAGEGREDRTAAREQLCAQRLSPSAPGLAGQWCVSAEGHVGPCAPGANGRALAANEFGPREAVSTRRGS